jgi:hypothetical protein
MKDEPADQYSEVQAERRREAALKKMQATPPKPLTPKAKANPRPAPTKAEIAAQKRADKMVIKRMRKR